MLMLPQEIMLLVVEPMVSFVIIQHQETWKYLLMAFGEQLM
jgi:hypothetical protein